MELKKIRLQRGKKQVEVCEAVGISQSFYCSIETGVRRPSVEIAKKIGAYLGFDWTLFYESDNKESQARSKRAGRSDRWVRQKR